MPQVVRTDQAEDDLFDILVRLGRSNPAAANRFSAEFTRTCDLLAQFPLMGTACDELQVGLRSFPVRRYVVFYRPINGGIEVIRVLHGARHFPNFFNP